MGLLPLKIKSTSLEYEFYTVMAKTIEQKNIENMGLYYLERFSASKAHFKMIMMRKVKRRCERNEIPYDPRYLDMIDAVAEKFETMGYLNDKAYIESLIRSNFSRGLAIRRIEAKLMQKGLKEEDYGPLLSQFIETIETSDPDLAAGVRYLRKKKLGCFAPRGKAESLTPQKTLQRLAYGGFSYHTCQALLDMSLEDAEAILYPLASEQHS